MLLITVGCMCECVVFVQEIFTFWSCFSELSDFIILFYSATFSSREKLFSYELMVAKKSKEKVR